MAQDKVHIKAEFPLPVYNYRVSLMSEGNIEAMGFSEVTGLSIEHDTVTYRHGMSFILGHKIIPGMQKPLNITLKRGVLTNSPQLLDWISNTYSLVSAMTGTKRDIVVELCDESATPLIRWTVQDAMPVKLEAPAFDANSNEIAIEQLELIAHGLRVDYSL